MQHRRVRKILSAYLDGELEERERRFVEEHLKGCEECARELQALKAVDQMAAESKVPEPSEAYWKTLPAMVRTRIIAEGEKSEAARARRALLFRPARLRLIATCAAVVLVALVGRHYLFEERPDLMTTRRPVEEFLAERSPEGIRAVGPEDEVSEVSAGGAVKPQKLGSAEKSVKGEAKEAEAPEASVPPSTIYGERPTPRADVTTKSKDAYSERAVRTPPPEPEELDKQEVAGALEEKEPLSASARLKLAQVQQKRGDYDDAIRNYYLVAGEDEKLAPSARFQINLVHSTVKDTGSDEETLRRKTEMWQSFVEDYPKSEHVSEGYRNLADNAYQLARLTHKEKDIQQAIAAANRCLDFIKEGRTTEYRLRARQIDDLQRDLERQR